MTDLASILPDTLPGFSVQADSSGPIPDGRRFPASTDGIRVVQIRDDTVLTAMVSRFPGAEDAHASVVGFGDVLFSYPAQIVALEGLDSLSEDARGAVAARIEEAPGAIVMIAWSTGSLRLDLSVSVLREEVDEESFWTAFPRADLDAIAMAMQLSTEG